MSWRPPRDQLAYAGMNAEFSVGVVGLPPLSCQWQFKGSNVAAATASCLYLANVQADSAGSYTVVVTNLYGGVTSNATLTVISAAPTFDAGRA